MTIFLYLLKFTTLIRLFQKATKSMPMMCGRNQFMHLVEATKLFSILYMSYLSIKAFCIMIFDLCIPSSEAKHERAMAQIMLAERPGKPNESVKNGSNANSYGRLSKFGVYSIIPSQFVALSLTLALPL